jgi:hypothetical protein
LATWQIVQHFQGKAAKARRRPVIAAWRKWDGLRRQAHNEDKDSLISQFDPWPNKTLPEPDAAAILAAVDKLAEALK